MIEVGFKKRSNLQAQDDRLTRLMSGGDQTLKDSDDFPSRDDFARQSWDAYNLCWWIWTYGSVNAHGIPTDITSPDGSLTIGGADLNRTAILTNPLKTSAIEKDLNGKLEVKVDNTTIIKDPVSGILSSIGDDLDGDSPITTQGSYFQFTVYPTSALTTFTVPVAGIYDSFGNYSEFDWNVNWGDGTSQRYTGTGSADNIDITHTYTTYYQDYIVEISPVTEHDGWLQAFGFGEMEDYNDSREMLRKILTPLLPNMRKFNYRYACYAMFYRCIELISICDNFLPINDIVLNNQVLGRIFYGCINLTAIPNDLFPIGNLTMDNIFYQALCECTDLMDIGNIDINWFDGKVPQIGMFGNDINIRNPMLYDDIPAGWK